MRKFVFALLFLLCLPLVLADEDNYFSVKENWGPYTALPGDTVVVQFTISNRELRYPRNVTASIDPCPVGWECESKTFSYPSTGVYPENLTVKIPDTASPKMYTLYVMLSSEYMVRRGDDRVVFKVVTERQARTISYEEYKSRNDEQPKNPALAAVNTSAPKRQQVVEQPLTEEQDISAIIPKINRTDVADTVENMESSSQFKEYITVVLVVVLVFIAAGGYLAWKKKTRK